MVCWGDDAERESDRPCCGDYVWDEGIAGGPGVDLSVPVLIDSHIW